MDWQDVLSLIVFLVLVAFSKKRKPSEEADTSLPEEEPSFSEIDTVRKKIEALKQQRRQTSREAVAPQEGSVKVRPAFSAYKHLPKEEAVLSVKIPEVPVMPMAEKPKDVIKSIDLPHKTSKLHNWMVGQIVLGTPAYRRYGNFVHR